MKYFRIVGAGTKFDHVQTIAKMNVKIADIALKKLDTFNTQDIANTVWAYAKLGHSSPTLLDAIGQSTVEKIDTLSLQHINNIVWAYATLGRSSPKLFDAILPKAIQRLKELPVQGITSLLWSMAVLNYSNIDAAEPLFNEITKRYNLQLNNNNNNKFYFGESSTGTTLRQLHQASLWYNIEHNKDPLPPPKLRVYRKSIFGKE